MKLFFPILVTLLITNASFSQRNLSDSIIGTPWIGVQYGLNSTSGDLRTNHLMFNNIGMFGGYKTNKNWIFGLDANFMFGNRVQAPGLFDALVDSKGNITDINGDIATVLVLSRGLYVDAAVGKIFPVLSPNVNSGIMVKFGVGWLVHKMRIETRDQVVPQLELDYKKGYDRLTSGINTEQFIGYNYMANQGFLNFYGGFFIQEGFTYNRRTIYFDQPDTPVSTDMKLDIQYGVRVGWIIPIYKRQPKEYYYD